MFRCQRRRLNLLFLHSWKYHHSTKPQSSRIYLGEKFSAVFVFALHLQFFLNMLLQLLIVILCLNRRRTGRSPERVPLPPRLKENTSTSFYPQKTSHYIGYPKDYSKDYSPYPSYDTFAATAPPASSSAGNQVCVFNG